MKMLKILLLLLVITVSCVQTSRKKIIYSPDEIRAILIQQKQARGIPVDTRPLYELNEDIRQNLEKFQMPSLSLKLKIRRLKNFLQTGEHKIHYSPTSTLDAIECYENKKGNCFSLTNLAVGIFRELDLNSYYILVEDQISNSVMGDLVVHTNHLVCGVDVKSKVTDGLLISHKEYGLARTYYTEIVDFIPNPRKYVFTTVLSDIEATGLFYNNIASTFLLNRDYDNALKLYEFALTLYPDSYQIQNNIGVTYLSLKNYTRALFHLQNAVKQAKFPDLIMQNLVSHYEKTGNSEEIARLMSELNKTRKRNPYLYISLANLEYEKGNNDKAVYYLKTAKNLNKKIPEIYDLLSKIYSSQGEFEKSEKAQNLFLKFLDIREKERI